MLCIAQTIRKPWFLGEGKKWKEWLCEPACLSILDQTGLASAFKSQDPGGLLHSLPSMSASHGSWWLEAVPVKTGVCCSPLSFCSLQHPCNLHVKSFLCDPNSSCLHSQPWGDYSVPSQIIPQTDFHLLGTAQLLMCLHRLSSLPAN